MTRLRKLTAFLAAIVMSVSAMSLTAGAAQTHYWSLRYIPNSSGTNRSVDERVFVATQSSYYAKDTCTSFSTSTASNGLKAQVKLMGYITDSSGDNILGMYETYPAYYLQTSSYSKMDFVNTAGNPFLMTEGHKLIVRHTLVQPPIGPVQCNMSGTSSCEF